MILSNQKTIKNSILLKGRGLHSGKSASISIYPEQAGHGITFQRSDIKNAPKILASFDHIQSTDLATTIGHHPDHSISTIEHLMAALFGLGIDSVSIKVDGPEVPILDGSSQPFVEKILEAGIESFASYRKAWIVRKPFLFRMDDKYVKINPGPISVLRTTIDFQSSLIGKQFFEMELNSQNFIKISSARTFCYLRDVERMKKMGLALGGSLENAVVISDEGILNPEGLRSSQEFIHHKTLDAIGDLSLLGAPLIGTIELYKPGHTLHYEFMKFLMKNKSEYLSSIEPLNSASMQNAKEKMSPTRINL